MKSSWLFAASIERREPYLGDWPGSCKPSGKAASQPRGRQDLPRNWGTPLVLPQSMLHAETKSTLRRAWPLLAAAGLLAALVAVVAPSAADSAPLRVVVLGQTPETPQPSCPGKEVNGVPVAECRVEGHVTGFQAIADGIARPYEAPFEGKIVAWSVTLAKPSAADTDTTTDEVGFFNDFFGTPSEARIGILRPIEDSK